MKLSKILLLQCLIASPFLSPAFAQRSGTPLNLEIDVQLRLPDGSPGPRGVHILLENPQGGVDGECISLEGGKCQFLPKEKGIYIVSVDGGGYVEVSERVELTISRRGFATLTLRKADEAHPDNLTSAAPGGMTSVQDLKIPEKARQELIKGEKALQANNADEGLKHFQAALKIYEPYPQAYRLLGETYLKKQQWQEAETALKRSIELEPKLFASYVDLGAIRNQTRNYSGAEEALKKSLELSPDSPAAQYELARTYWATNRWQEAAPLAEAAVKGLPDHASAHVLLANIRLKQRDAAGALHEYQEYLRLDPDGAMAPQVRDMVAKLQKASPQ